MGQARLIAVPSPAFVPRSPRPRGRDARLAKRLLGKGQLPIWLAPGFLKAGQAHDERAELLSQHEPELVCGGQALQLLPIEHQRFKADLIELSP